MAVDADIRDVASRTNDCGAELERVGDADGFDRDVDTQALGSAP